LVPAGKTSAYSAICCTIKRPLQAGDYLMLRASLILSTLPILFLSAASGAAAQEVPAARVVVDHPQSEPQPPCGMEPIPAYPNLDDPAILKSWSASDLGRDWKPPACTGWTTTGFTGLVTIAARFRHTSEAEGLLRQIGAVSELAGMHYWSTTHKRWQTLIVEAYALGDSQPGRRRKDFMPDEMKQGAVLYVQQVDNLSGKAIYKMHFAEVSANRIVYDVENVSTMRYFLMPILHPGEIQSIYFLDRESKNIWRYYSIVRTGKHANRLIAGNESSSVNRAIAYYRHLVGIPTDQEPPAAR
jgi:hypothetical protein